MYSFVSRSINVYKSSSSSSNQLKGNRNSRIGNSKLEQVTSFTEEIGSVLQDASKTSVNLASIDGGITKEEIDDEINDEFRFQSEDDEEENSSIHETEILKLRSDIRKRVDGTVLKCPDKVYQMYFDKVNQKYKNFNMIKHYIASTIVLEPETNCFDNEKDNSSTNMVGGGCPFSTYDAANLIQQYFVKQKIKRSSRHATLELLHQLFPNAKLPLKETGAGNILSEAHLCGKHNVLKEHVILIHCCPNLDHVYVGDYMNETYCRNCKFERFTPCVQCQKIHNLGSNICNHSLMGRTPLKILQYRPLISIFKLIFDSPQAKLLINYVDQDAKPGIMYHDIMFTDTTVKHINEMKANFKTFLLGNLFTERLQSGEINKITDVNILLSCGYDGVKYFNWKIAKVCPLVISILNMPPPMRKINGIGTHTLGIYVDPFSEEQKKQFGAKEKENRKEVHKFFFRKCFVEELLLLNDGVLLNTSSNGHIFLQVRLINHNYDTPALQEMFNVQCSQSCEGCPFCEIVEGKYKVGAGSVVYIGHRCLLPIEHVFRYKGQSKQLSPQLFYTSKYKESDESPPWANCTLAKTLESEEDVDNLRLEGEMKEEEIEAADTTPDFDRNGDPTSKGLAKIKQRLKEIIHEKRSAIWFHDDVCSYRDFIEVSYAHHCDYRLKKYRRKTNKRYLENACVYAELNEKRKKKIAVEGVTGISEFAALPYLNCEEQSMFDPAHALGNACTESLLILRGDEGVDEKTVKYCKKYGFHPSLYSKSNDNNNNQDNYQSSDAGNKNSKDKQKATKKQKPTGNNDCNVSYETKEDKKKRVPKLRALYTLQPIDMRRIEYWIDCLLIPRGHVNKYHVPKVFSGTLKLTTQAKIHTMTALMELMITALLSDKKCKYPLPYISYLRVFSNVMSRLLRTQFSNDDLEDLFNRIVEFLSLHELVFPHTSSKIIHHQLLDFPEHIKKAGPLRNFWSLYVERTLSKIKNIGVKKGGKFEKSTLENTIEYDAMTLETTLESLGDPKKLENLKQKLGIECLMYSSGRLVYSDTFTKPIMTAKSADDQDIVGFNAFTAYEQLGILEVLLDILELKRQNSPIILWKESLLFRIQGYFRFQVRRKKLSRNVDFLDYMYELSQIINFDESIEDSSTKKARFILISKDDEQKLFESINNEKEESRMLAEGFFLLSDIQRLQNWFDAWKFRKHRSAYVLGCLFNGRGEPFCEKEAPLIVDNASHSQQIFIPNNHLNRKNYLIAQWKNPKMYSSWVKYRLVDSRKDSYGQLNLFYQIINCPCYDGILNDELFASVCGRIVKWANNISPECKYPDPHHSRLASLIAGGIDSTYDCTRSFISVRCIYSSPIAVIALNSKGQPISKNTYIAAAANINYVGGDEEAGGGEEDENRAMLYEFKFVDLEPSRLHLLKMV